MGAAIYSSCNYLLSSYWKPGTLPGRGHSNDKTGKVSTLRESTFQCLCSGLRGLKRQETTKHTAPRATCLLQGTTTGGCSRESDGSLSRTLRESLSKEGTSQLKPSNDQQEPAMTIWKGGNAGVGTASAGGSTEGRAWFSLFRDIKKLQGGQGGR